MGLEEARLDEGDGGVVRLDGGGGVVVVEAGCFGAGCACNVREDCKDSTYAQCVDHRCSECTLEPDSCPTGAYCLSGSAPGAPPSKVNVCAPGCSTDEACKELSPSSPFCELSRHQCVQCRPGRDDCSNLNEKCSPAGICARTCPDGGGCSPGQTCCNDEICVDVKTDVAHCSACNKPCTGSDTLCCNGVCKDPLKATDACGNCATDCATKVVNATGVACTTSKCTYTTCAAAFGNCNGDKADGCECACPAECSSCTGGVCVKTCGVNGCQTGYTCPANLPCRVECAGEHACQGTIRCAPNQPCTVACTTSAACDGLTVEQGVTLCLDCAVSGACSNVNCGTTTCSKVCAGGACNNTCANCGATATCP